MNILCIIGRDNAYPTALWAMENIMNKELGVTGITYTDVAPYNTWKYAFCIDRKINSKKVIEGIASVSPYIPRFDNYGNFTYDTIFNAFSREDISNLSAINKDDVIKYQFSQTKREDIITSVRAYYRHDNGRKKYSAYLDMSMDEIYPEYGDFYIWYDDPDTMGNNVMFEHKRLSHFSLKVSTFHAYSILLFSINNSRSDCSQVSTER